MSRRRRREVERDGEPSRGANLRTRAAFRRRDIELDVRQDEMAAITEELLLRELGSSDHSLPSTATLYPHVSHHSCRTIVIVDPSSLCLQSVDELMLSRDEHVDVAAHLPCS